MKIAFLVSSLVMLLSGAVSAQSNGPVNSGVGEEKICEKLYAKADASCMKSICKEYGPDCGQDGDVRVESQICVSEGELQSVIKAYNRKNPTKKVKCVDFQA